MDASPTSAARSRRVPVTAVVAALVLGLSPAQAQAKPLEVAVNGRVLKLASTATVADALALAGVRPRIGVMRSAVTGSPLDVETRQAELIRNGRRVAPTAALRDGDRVAVRPAADWMEPTVLTRVTIEGSPLPMVETRLWHQSHKGVVERLVGQFSGEIVTETVIEEAKPATMVTGREIVLTFDDGPDARWTPAVLDILRDKGAKAVFCMVGTQMRRFPDLVRRVHAEGHVVCNHTMDHDSRLRERSADVIRERIDSVSALTEELTGTRPRFYRAPGGNLSQFIIDHVRSQGMRVLGWTIDPHDYRKPGADVILERIATSASPGALTLLHDGGGDRAQTVAQLPGLLDRLRADTYSIAVPT